jgi:pheromone shutdown protein TraB
MTQKLTILTEEHEKVIAVVGDGHIPGVSRLLEEKNIKFETIRLSQLRNQGPSDADSSTASFSMEYKET